MRREATGKLVAVPVRAYADTSVFGGVFDEEFAKSSKMFFQLVRDGVYRLVLATPVRDELTGAPAHVRKLLSELAPHAESLEVTEAAIDLQEAYLRAGVVTVHSRLDALHVALATVARCGLIVSWNFKHIVNFRRIPLYNGVNMANGYGPLAICSPLEVIEYEDDETV